MLPERYLKAHIFNKRERRSKERTNCCTGTSATITTMKNYISLSIAFLSFSAAKKHDKPLDPHMFNFQSGIDFGSTMAGGMTFDKEHNRLYLTGGTYARGFFTPETSYIGEEIERNSDCFFVTVELADPAADKNAEWKNPTRLGYVKDPEACSTVHYMDGHDRVFLGASASGESVGRVDIDGDVLPQLSDVSLFGEVISVSLDHVYNIAPVIPQHYLFGGHGFFQSEVNFPFAVTSDHKTRDETSSDDEEEAIYVASLYSKYGGQWAEDVDEKEIDLTSPYIDGNVWGIAIQKIRVNHSNATKTASILENPTHMERVWMKNLETTNFQKLQTADMVFANGYLLLAGSTYDFGEDFAGEQRADKNFQDYDGFLVKIDPDTGDVATSNNDTEKMKHRIQSRGEEADDVIHGICLHPANEDGYVQYIYVVGSTAGEMHSHDHEFSGGGFIMQVDLHTMEEIWKNDMAGTNLEATDCAVTDDGKWLYVTGIARNGATIPDYEFESNGGDDIWVRQYGLEGRIEERKINWQIQFGSENDEALAKGGAITIDSQNNAIIYGNTRGSVGRWREESVNRFDNTTDIFVTLVTADGGYLAPSDDQVYQIPRYYFEGSGTSQRIWIGCLFAGAFILFSGLMILESKWKPVSLTEAMSDLKGLLPKMTEHEKVVFDFTESETEEEDGIFNMHQSTEESSVASGVSSLRSMESAAQLARNARRQQLQNCNNSVPTLMADYPPHSQSYPTDKFEEEKREID